MTQLPVPMEFRLPDHWRPVSPESAGMPAAAFVAVRQESDSEFRTNIAIGGRYRPDDVTLATIADESVRRLSTSAVVDVAARSEAGSEQAPTLTQVLYLEMSGAEPSSVVQQQAYVAMHDRHDPARRVVLEIALTTTPARFPEASEDFQQFLRTLRPVPPRPDEVPPGHQRVSAETLEIAAQADDAPAEYRSLAKAVREGRATWAKIVAGESEDVPEVRALREESRRRTRQLLGQWGVPAGPEPSTEQVSPAAAAKNTGVLGAAPTDRHQEESTKILRIDSW